MRKRTSPAWPRHRLKLSGPRTMIRDMRNRLCLDVSLPCQVCSSFATGTCAYCGVWTCDKHVTSTEGTREGYMFDERWCRPCYRGFHGGPLMPASATQAHSHEAHPHGCLWRPSAQQPQCLHCGGPIVDKADPVTCAHCGEAVHRRCFKTHSDTCQLQCNDVLEVIVTAMQDSGRRIIIEARHSTMG